MHKAYCNPGGGIKWTQRWIRLQALLQMRMKLQDCLRVSANWERKFYFFFSLYTALSKRDISFCQTADCGLNTKGWPHAHIFANHIKWHDGTPTHLHTHTNIPYKSNFKKNRACTEEERFANWSEQPRRKGFKYHWKWGQCDCITSGSAELVKCLWWPWNSILQTVQYV